MKTIRILLNNLQCIFTCLGVLMVCQERAIGQLKTLSFDVDLIEIEENTFIYKVEFKNHGTHEVAIFMPSSKQNPVPSIVFDYDDDEGSMIQFEQNFVETPDTELKKEQGYYYRIKPGQSRIFKRIIVNVPKDRKLLIKIPEIDALEYIISYKNTPKFRTELIIKWFTALEQELGMSCSGPTLSIE